VRVVLGLNLSRKAARRVLRTYERATSASRCREFGSRA
jgi:hypothetical protein